MGPLSHLPVLLNAKRGPVSFISRYKCEWIFIIPQFFFLIITKEFLHIFDIFCKVDYFVDNMTFHGKKISFTVYDLTKYP